MRFAAAALFCCAVVSAAELPVMQIAFEGNAQTREKVMLRELPFSVGDAADAALIERGRQAIQDLGLFSEVAVRTEPLRGGQRVVYSVRERFYLLPLPRLDLNSDGEFAYGAQLRLSNVWGLNHNFTVFAQTRETREEDVGRERNYALSYSAPLVFDTPMNVGGGLSYTSRPVETEQGEMYEERFQNAAATLTRQLSGSPSQGWNAGVGFIWQNQQTAGASAPEAYGMATAFSVLGGYRDLRFKIFSEEGLSFGARLDVATEGLGGDYDYIRYTAGATRFWPLGSLPHQTLHLIGELGAYHGGPREIEAFALGGSSELRGYDPDFLEGDAFYRLALEYARPLVWNELRLAVIAEAGNVFADPGDLEFGRIYTTLGVGLRLRLPRFVNFEIELGYSVPLGTRGDGRWFGGRV